MRFSNPAPASGAPTIVSVVANGAGVAVIGTPPPGQAWYVNRITVTSTIASTAYVYVGAITNANIVDGTTSGGLDEAEYPTGSPPGLFVPSGSALTVVFATAGGTQTVRVEYVARAVT